MLQCVDVIWVKGGSGVSSGLFLLSREAQKIEDLYKSPQELCGIVSQVDIKSLKERVYSKKENFLNETFCCYTFRI